MTTLMTSIRRTRSLCLTLALAASLAALTGCNNGVTPPDDNDNDGNGSGQPIRAEILSPASSFGVSLLDSPISVVYSMPTSATEISGFFVEIQGPSPDRPPVGDPVTIAENLPTGASQSFSFTPADAGLGYFRLGLSYALDGEAAEVLSSGVIHVQGSPSPSFVDPDQDLVVVEKGDDLNISFDLGDPDGVVQWRLFYLAEGQSPNASPNQLGTQLTTGTGNSGGFVLKTGSMALGDYQLGISATDSGSSVAATASRGELAKIITIPNDSVDTPTVRIIEPGGANPPTIEVTAPASEVVLFRDDPFTIQLKGQVNLDGADGRIRVFYDTDRNPTNGTTTIRQNAPENTTSVAFPTTLYLNFPADVPQQSYNIGGTITDDVNAPVTAYAPGRITVVDDVTLEVTQPGSVLPVTPGTMVNVAWTTNAPASAGTVDVFAQAIDANDQPTADPPIVILDNQPMSVTSAKFTSDEPGRFLVTVVLNIRDNTTMQDTAPQPVRFSSLPGVLWVHTLADRTAVAGAIFGGVQPEDNAGSALSTAGDLDGDGFDEFAVVARFGKPRFNNPNGIGQGEAYVVYGGVGPSRLLGEYNLNSVGDTLPGVTFTGIRAASGPGIVEPPTDGFSGVTLIPDADGDERGELVFSFNYTFSEADGLFAPRGQFDEGGIITVSSLNSAFDFPFSDRVMELADVGRNFALPPVEDDEEPIPFIIGGPTLDSRFSCAEDPATPGTCLCDGGPDEIIDSISIGFGFGGRLATIPVLPCFTADIDPDFGFTDIPPPQYTCTAWPLAPGACTVGSPWQWGLTTCGDGSYGAGMINPDTLIAEPFGARVIGPRAEEGEPTGSHFGMSIGVSVVAEGIEDILVSAPSIDDGVIYMFNNAVTWAVDAPRPFQYIATGGGVCPGTPNATALTGLALGSTGDSLTEVNGIQDFNNDGRNDFVTSSPPNGRVYVAYRREEQLEGTYQLSKLAHPLDHPERLDGLLITGGADFGKRLAMIDLNDDGFDDLVISKPTANLNTGEIYIVFSHSGVVTQGNGSTIASLLDETACGPRLALKITGDATNKGQFGLNMVNAGDLDGDGRDELVVASPDSTPKYDPDPSDGVDALTANGIDLNEDGVADNPWPVDRAGLVYIINGSTLFDRTWACTSGGALCNPDVECDVNEECINPNPELCNAYECVLKGEFCRVNNDCPNGHRCSFGRCASATPQVCNPNQECAAGTCRPELKITQLGKKGFPGFLIAGRRADDQLGGGNSGKTVSGIDESRGLAAGGDIDGDGRADLLIGSMLADPRPDPASTRVIPQAGETYLLYGSATPDPK